MTLKHLRKASLEDIAKKLNLKVNSDDKVEIAKAVERHLDSKTKISKFFNSIYFKLGFPILLSIGMYQWGKYSDIPNTQIHSSMSESFQSQKTRLEKLSSPIFQEWTLQTFSVVINLDRLNSKFPGLKSRIQDKID